MADSDQGKFYWRQVFKEPVQKHGICMEWVRKSVEAVAAQVTEMLVSRSSDNWGPTVCAY